MRKESAILAAVITVTLLPAVVSGQARVEKNVVVGMYSGLALVMDVHHPEDPNGFGIVYISGSGWLRPLSYDAPLLSEAAFNVAAQPLVDHGYTVFSLNHRSTPRFQHPAPLEDVQRSVRFIRSHADEYGINPDRIGAVGGSSGGHLALMLGLMDGDGDPDDPDPVNRVSARVQAVVAKAAPSDLRSLVASTGSVATALLLGAMPSPNLGSVENRRYEEASPINHVSSDDSPTLLVHGDADQRIPIEQASMMHDALSSAGVETRLIVVPGGGHGPTFPGAANGPDHVAAMIAWFDAHLGT